MSRGRSRLATGVGLGAFLIGIVVLAMAVPTRNGTGLTLLVESPSASAYAACLIGGPAIGLAGAVVGIRYGNFERYHSHYNAETGRIEDHWFAAVAELASESYDETADGATPPERYVPSRLAVAAILVLPTAALYAYLVSTATAILGWTWLLFIGAFLAICSLVLFLVSDLALRSLEEDYPRH